MLALAIDAMLDFAGDRSGHFRMIECEAQSHDAYGRRANVRRVLRVIKDTMRELLGTDWSRRSTRHGGYCWASSTASSRRPNLGGKTQTTAGRRPDGRTQLFAVIALSLTLRSRTAPVFGPSMSSRRRGPRSRGAIWYPCLLPPGLWRSAN